MEAIVWHMSLIIGTAVFLIGVFYLISRENRVRLDFIKATAIELLSSWVLWLPYELYEEVTVSNPVLHLTESLITALMRALNTFSIEEYTKLVYSGSENLTSAFAIVRVLVSISVALFAFGWIMSFFDGPIQRIRLLLRRKSPLYIFPECNEKTAAIARSILEKPGKDGKKEPSEGKEKRNAATIVFLTEDEISSSERKKIEEMGGMVLEQSLPSLIRQLRKHPGAIEVFIFGRSDEENLQQLERAFDEGDVGRCRSIRFFVEILKTPWDLCDHYVERKLGKKQGAGDGSSDEGSGEVRVNFVRTEENSVYNTLWRHSFLKYVKTERDGMKRAEVLIVGINDRSIEMFRALLHLSQLPGYSISLTVLDEGRNLGKLRAQMPGIVFDKPVRRWGDAIYSIRYLENVDLDADMPDAAEEALSSFTFAYVNAGDDVRDVSLAIRLNEMRQRAVLAENCGEYEIMVDVAHLSEKNWNPEKIAHLTFAGSFDEAYSHGFITMSEIETASRAVHNQRQADRAEIEDREGGTYEKKPWASYDNDEYNRRSVYARTLSLRYKYLLLRDVYADPDGALLKTEEWKVSEHMRWNMYTRTIGYLNPDTVMHAIFEEVRDVAREKATLEGKTGKQIERAEKKAEKEIRKNTHVHEDLIGYEELPEMEKGSGNDEITISEEVRKQLEKGLDAFAGGKGNEEAIGEKKQ